MQLFYCPNVKTTPVLDAVESQHCIKVLRHQVGDEINLIDGQGSQFIGTIVKANAKACELNDVELIRSTENSSRLHIAIAPTKNHDRMEWFIEKATEIGLREVTFIKCQNSVRPRINPDRLKRKAISAIKQNQSLWLPQINPMISFPDFISEETTNANKLIAYVEEKKSPRLSGLQLNTKTDSIVLIGPEGDFSKEEVKTAIEAGYKLISLGQNVLRTETAGVVVCATFTR